MMTMMMMVWLAPCRAICKINLFLGKYIENGVSFIERKIQMDNEISSSISVFFFLD